jgi:hypothetical protein
MQCGIETREALRIRKTNLRPSGIHHPQVLHSGQHHDRHVLELPRTRRPVPNVDPKSNDQDASKKTEGLELGAVDKLLVGIFVGCNGRWRRLVSTHSSRPSYLFHHCYPITI